MHECINMHYITTSLQRRMTCLCKHSTHMDGHTHIHCNVWQFCQFQSLRCQLCQLPSSCHISVLLPPVWKCFIINAWSRHTNYVRGGCLCSSESSGPQQCPQLLWQEQMTSLNQSAWLQHMTSTGWPTMSFTSADNPCKSSTAVFLTSDQWSSNTSSVQYQAFSGCLTNIDVGVNYK